MLGRVCCVMFCGASDACVDVELGLDIGSAGGSRVAGRGAGAGADAGAAGWVLVFSSIVRRTGGSWTASGGGDEAGSGRGRGNSGWMVEASLAAGSVTTELTLCVVNGPLPWWCRTGRRGCKQPEPVKAAAAAVQGE